METKKINQKKRKLPKNFKVNSNLKNEYGNQPLFKDKVDRANHILKTVTLPKFETLT